jgi:multiple sugar transport system ATP-binding protein
VRKVAGLLQIEHLLERKPAQLSGGQRQRVAIGRALVRDPKIFLFDEPLSNLDARLRVDMRTEIKKLHQRLGTTIVYVTHDQIEAMTLASRIAVMRDGMVQQFATPQEVYERPANMYVAGFIGSPPMNFIAGRVADDAGRLGVTVDRIANEKTAPLFLPLPGAAPGHASLAGMAGRPIVLGVRPEAIGWANQAGSADHADHPAHVRFDCAVSVLEPTGADTMAIIRLGETEAVARIRPSDPAAPGATAPFVIDMTKVNLFDPQSERRI